MSEVENKPPLPVGPRSDIHYPISVYYCGNCHMPVEYCEYWPEYDKCKSWLEKNLPEEYDKRIKLQGSEDGETGGEEEKKKPKQKRGGKGQIKTKKKQEKPQEIKLFLAPRGKKKFVTVIQGLSTYDIDIKTAAKVFAQKFSCGSSVTGDDEIVVQGDFKFEVADLICDKWPQVDKDSIEDLGEMKR